MTTETACRRPKAPAKDELREALAAALKGKRVALAAVESLRAAIRKARAAVRGREADLERAVQKVEKARGAHAEALAAAIIGEAISADTTPVRAARQAVVDGEDELEAARAAVVKLNADLPACEEEAKNASIAVEAAISAIFARAALPMLETAAALKRDLAVWRASLEALWQDAPVNAFGSQNIVAREQAPLAETHTAIMKLMNEPFPKPDAEDNPWQATREALRLDAHVELPSFVRFGRRSAQ